MHAFSRKYEIFLRNLFRNCYLQRENQYGKILYKGIELTITFVRKEKNKEIHAHRSHYGNVFGTRISVSYIYNKMYETPIVGKDDVCNRSGEILAQVSISKRL